LLPDQEHARAANTANAPTIIAVEKLTKRFPSPGDAGPFVVIEEMSISVGDGEFVAIVGPSGCGKSTLLNIIAGIETYDSGRVTMSPRFGRRQKRPRVAYVFQTPRLLNWLTVKQNIEFVLEAQAIPRERWPRLVSEHLALVGLAGQEDNYPLNLSGGMQQRVAIARALAIEPDILLMDEPFSHLDAITARKLRADLMAIMNRARPAILFVTHDLAEAVLLSDHIYMMETRPARIFKHVTVDVARPRTPEDERVFALEKELMREFFSVLETKG
jgi:ABC-type nitrate/sulfonate/bicarbonate transport system ATPase subunit